MTLNRRISGQPHQGRLSLHVILVRISIFREKDQQLQVLRWKLKKKKSYPLSVLRSPISKKYDRVLKGEIPYRIPERVIFRAGSTG